MGKIVTTITRINFTFDADCGLAVYLDARIDGERFGGTSTYITDLFELNYIKQLLNKGKTGHAKETFDQEALNTLVGEKAIFYMEEDNNTMHFKYIDTDYEDNVVEEKRCIDCDTVLDVERDSCYGYGYCCRCD